MPYAALKRRSSTARQAATWSLTSRFGTKFTLHSTICSTYHIPLDDEPRTVWPGFCLCFPDVRFHRVHTPACPRRSCFVSWIGWRNFSFLPQKSPRISALGDVVKKRLTSI
jgi:hypothetical protein